jgi:hypothetical protein
MFGLEEWRNVLRGWASIQIEMNWQLQLPLSRRKPGPMARLLRTSQVIAVAYQRPPARAAGRWTPAFAGEDE